MGARAYTTGTDIVFGEPSPDLHLIAHEAAHVIQQRGGVQLKGGVGEVGDPYERHADAVADLVVQGKSAESLLDTMAGGTASAPNAPATSGGAIQRKETPAHLHARQVEANAKVDGIGTDVETSVRSGLATTLVKLVTASHGAALTTAGKKEAADSITGATDIDLAAKAQAQTLASEAVVAQIKEKTDAVALANTGTVKLDATNAARAAISAAKPGRFFNTKTADLVANATSAARARAADGAAKRLEDAKKAIAKPEFLADLTKDAKKDSKNAMAQEKTDRTAADGAVIGLIGDPVDAARGVVHTAVQAYLEEYIGANGSKWFGHSEANAFRKKMKAAGRKKAYTDIEGIAGGSKTFTHANKHQHTEDRLKNAGTATRDYFVMQGKGQAYDDAKESVNEAMRQMAHDGTNKLLSTFQSEKKLTTVASTAAWDVLRDDPTNADTKKAATKAAQGALATEAKKQKDELLADGGLAATWTTTLTKGSGSTSVETLDDNDTPGTLDEGGAKTLVAQQVGDDHVGSKALETAIEGETIGDGLTKLGALIDLAVPNSGEALKLGVELKIPVPQAPGVFCVVKIEGQAERHQGKDLELTCSLEFGAGWETWGLSLDARLFLFCKARAADTDKALKMLSYGVYRDLSASPTVPKTMALGWATGKKVERTEEYSRTEEAETWAAMVEEYAMAGDDNAFAEAGEGVVGNAKLKAGLLEAQGKISGQTMRHWDKKTLTDAGVTIGAFSHVGDKAARKTAAKNKRKAATDAFQRRNQWNLETQFDIEAAGQKFGLGLKLQQVLGDETDARLNMLDVEIIGNIPYDPSNPASSTELSKIAGQYVPNALTGARAIYDRVANRQDKDGVLKGMGSLVDAGMDTWESTGAGGLTTDISKALTDVKMDGAKSDYMNETVTDTLGTRPTGEIEKQVSRHAMKSLLQLSIYRKDGKWGFTLAEVKKLDLGIGDRAGLGASATVSAEKTKKIFSAGQDGVNNW